MSIQGLLRKEISKKYKGRKKLLAPKSEKIFDMILLAWFILGYVLGSLVNGYGISFSDCNVCESIAAHMPSIYRMAVGSRYPEAMYYVWLYSLLTAPLILILLFTFVREFNRRVLTNWGVLLLLALGISAAYVCVVGMDFGGADDGGRFSELYYNLLLYSTLVACVFSAMVVISIFHITHHFIGVFKKEAVNDGR